MNWHIGCSGFYYKDWRGIFYPDKMPQRQWFEYYSARFNTLELNVTFYRFPQVSFLENWYNKSPENFLFTVKVPRLITHYKQLKGTDLLLKDFYMTIRTGLRNKLGAILFQMPPQFQFTEDQLEQLTLAVDTGFVNVVEFRHVSWWQQDIINALAKRNIIFCGISYPGLPEDVLVNSDIVYYRFHGLHRLYYSSYSPEELNRVADTIINNKNIKQAFIFFNNTATEAAIQNAGYFESYLHGSPVIAEHINKR